MEPAEVEETLAAVLRYTLCADFIKAEGNLSAFTLVPKTYFNLYKGYMKLANGNSGYFVRF